MTLIHFRCRSPRHLVRASRTGTIVMRSGTAAFCPSDAVDDRHVWEATGGVALETLLTTQAELWEDAHVDAGQRARDVSHQDGDARPFAGAR